MSFNSVSVDYFSEIVEEWIVSNFPCPVSSLVHVSPDIMIDILKNGVFLDYHTCEEDEETEVVDEPRPDEYGMRILNVTVKASHRVTKTLGISLFNSTMSNAFQFDNFVLNVTIFFLEGEIS